jgi:hypothetical protein
VAVGHTLLVNMIRWFVFCLGKGNKVGGWKLYVYTYIASDIIASN